MAAAEAVAAATAFSVARRVPRRATPREPPASAVPLTNCLTSKKCSPLAWPRGCAAIDHQRRYLLRACKLVYAPSSSDFTSSLLPSVK